MRGAHPRWVGNVMRRPRSCAVPRLVPRKKPLFAPWELIRVPVPAGGPRMSEVPHHEPVMVEEVIDLLRPVPPGVVVDATVGLGGHGRALLAALDHIRL